MYRVKKGVLALLLAALLLAAFGCQKQPAADENAVVLSVGDVPVYAVVYRHQIKDRLLTIERNNLYDWDTYLSFVVNPSIYYPYPYFDTRTEEGMRALCEDVLKSLSYEAASIYEAQRQGYKLSIEDQSYVLEAQENALDVLDELAEDYGSVDAFYAETGFTEDSFERMYAQSREASIDFSKLVTAYRETHTVDDAALEAGYARIVKETFEDRYTDGMYSQYLAYYMMGARSFPSLYIPDDAIFVRLFVNTDASDEQAAAFAALAETDFNALYTSEDNEFTAQGTAGDLAVAPNDELIDGLYDAAKDVAIGSVGSFRAEVDGKTVRYWFLRVEGETGIVPIDRYPGVREMIVNQLGGTQCMAELLDIVNDASVTTRNDALIESIIAAQIGA